MAILQLEARSLSAFMRVGSRVRRLWRYDDPWYRGHMRANWPLTPSLYRHHADETETRIEFQRVGSQLLIERQPLTPWEWYFLMQHHGTPTRLLDWTDGALIGLYFAVGGSGRRPARGNGDAAVWVLNPEWLNGHSKRIGRRIALPDKEEVRGWLPQDPVEKPEIEEVWPLAIDPPHLARRVAVQRSHFTVFGKHHNGLARLAQTDPQARLAQIVIPHASLPKIRRDLSSCGIHEVTLFPDLDALARELKDEFRE
jgi:FRG domain